MAAAKKKVDIYFVLYLIALVLLIPSKDNLFELMPETEPQDKIIDNPDNIYLEKNKLLYSLDNREGQLVINYADTVNTISFGGAIEAAPHVIIENLQYSGVYDFKGDFDNERFAFVNVGEGLWRFEWKPTNELIKQKSPSAYDVTIRSGDLERSFTITTIFEDIASIDLEQENENPDNSTIGFEPTPIPVYIEEGDFNLQARDVSLQTISNLKWENTIHVIGIDTDDLKGKIEVTSSVRGVDPVISKVNEKSFTIEGKAPINRRADITVRASSQIDNKEALTQFSVTPIPIKSPSMPEQIYPEVLYTIDPNYPSNIDYPVETYLVIGNDTIQRDLTGSKLRFSVSMADTGKTVKIKRTVGGQSIGITTGPQIRRPDAPTILEVNRASDRELAVRVRAYGGSRDNPNTVRLVVKPEGVNVRELFGDNSSCGPGCYEQNFLIRISEDNQTIRLQATDRLGQSSEIIRYP